MNTPSKLEEAEIPTAIWTGSFMLGGLEVKCSVLSDGRRIIDADDFNRFFSGKYTPTDEEINIFAKWSKTP